MAEQPLGEFLTDVLQEAHALKRPDLLPRKPGLLGWWRRRQLKPGQRPCVNCGRPVSPDRVTAKVDAFKCRCGTTFTVIVGR